MLIKSFLGELLQALFPFKKEDAVEGENGPEVQETIHLNTESVFTVVKKTLRNTLAIGGNHYTSIVFWTEDNNWYGILSSDDFKQRLRAHFDNNGFQCLARGEIVVNRGRPENVEQANPIAGGQAFYHTPINNDQEPGVITAQISCLEGCGSLIDTPVNIDSRLADVFNIGRGQRPDGEYNAIAINDNEQNENVRTINQHVSRHHAVIRYRDGSFHIQALPRGCRDCGNSTRIIHQNTTIDLFNDQLLYKLDNNDIIELGGEVRLLYTIILNH